MKLIKSLLLTAALLAFAACGGGGGGSSSDSVTVKTTVDLAGTKYAVSNMTRSARAEAITVTLTLADGTTYQMRDNGNGEYSCTVNDYNDGTVGYVEAHAGDIVLKNFFDSLSNQSGEADIGSTDPDSTLFVDILQTYAEALTNNGNEMSAAQLMAGFTNASLQIDVNTFKKSVKEDSTYEQIRQTYTSNLTWENYYNGTEVSNAVATAFESSEVYDLITTGGIEIPSTSDDLATAKQAMETLYTAYSTGDFASLAAAVSDTDFLNDGYDAANWLNGIQLEYQDLEGDNLKRVLVSKSVNAVKVEDADRYNVFIYSHYQLKDKTSGVIKKEERDSEAADAVSKKIPMIVQKSGDAWALIGNQKKSEMYFDVTYSRDGSVLKRKLWAEVTESDLYPVSSATVRGGAFSGTLPLEHNAVGDSDIYYFSATEGESRYYPGYETTAGTAITWVSNYCDARNLNMTVNYTNGTSDSVDFLLPACPDTAYLNDFMPDIGNVVKNGDGSVTISYTITDSSQLSHAFIHVFDANTGATVYQADEMPFAQTSLTIPNGTLSVGSYNIVLYVVDIQGRGFIDSANLTYN